MATPDTATVPALGDVHDSVAFSLLDDLKKAKKLTEEEHAQYKSFYELLHNRVIETHEKERTLLKLSRRKQNDVLGEKIKLERAIEKLETETRELDTLEAERERVQKDLDDAEQKDTVNKYELAELERTHTDLTTSKDDLEKENKVTVLPELERLRAECENIKEAYKRQDEAFSKEAELKAKFLERNESLDDDLVTTAAELNDSKDALLKAQAEPQRIRKQAESVNKAADNLSAEMNKFVAKVANADEQLAKQGQKRAEADVVKVSLARKLDLHQSTIEHRQTDVEAIQRNLDQERATQHDLQTTKVQLELARKNADEDLRHGSEDLSFSKKEYEQKKRFLRKKRNMADGVREVLPTLQATLVDHEHTLRVYQDENTKLDGEIEELKQDVDVHIARFMKAETNEVEKRAELDRLIKGVAEQEGEIHQWQAEERRQNKLIALLAAQRELKAREATRAAQLEKESRQQVKVKELVILDLTKKCNEVNNRLKEFSALYDVVKNERNKYVNLIQASSQALAEMKEKIKILNNEVEILRNESLAKDKALGKEASSHVLSKNQRDSLRLELNKSQQEYRRKQESVQQQIEEVKTLNSIINGLEREMLRLKRQYEEAVEKRNETGVSLIDRNDELCILYEKANLQEATFKRGEVAVRQREEEVRALKLELAELERQLMVARKKTVGGADLAERAEWLADELAEQREETAILCKELEDPSNEERFRKLAGDDPDLEQLSAKVSVLEARLDEKKEGLLEKELVLEEVTTLTQKLRNRAGDGREGTLKLAQRVNEFQGRIRDITRRMMATVSELSMYQATAMKLQQEKNVKKTELEEARWRVAHGQPPSEDAEREWFRLEQAQLARAEARLMGRSQGNLAVGGQEEDDMVVPTVAVRTTAEPRPNAYIPDDLGIPKPYGGLAPFKPIEAGATMRHIRAPNPPEIEI